LQQQKQVRRKIRAQRRALTQADQRRHSRAAIQILAGSSLFRNSHRIGIYLAHDGEIDITYLLTRIVAQRKQCYLPALRPMLPNRLWFSEYRIGDRLIHNRYGIVEPDIHRRKPIPAWGLDLVLMPLVAFDTSGNRIGMGGGFYDRTFAYLKARNSWHTPKLIGIARELQRIDSITPNPWDIPLDGIVTESRIYPMPTNKFA
jgi:5-formyltetrahydrofolate cyclo-ligase